MVMKFYFLSQVLFPSLRLYAEVRTVKSEEKGGLRVLVTTGVGCIYLISSVRSSLTSRVTPAAGSEALTWLQLF